MNKHYIFLSFSLGNTSVSDYFLELAKKMSHSYNVVIFSDTVIPDALVIPKNIEVKKWPSKRPTKLKDALFLYQNIKKYKPKMTISNFGSVNIFMLIGFLCNVKVRVAWIRTLSTQFPQKKINVIRKTFIYKLATKIITNSEATKKDSIHVFKINASKVFVLPNSVKNYNHILNNTIIDKTKIVYVGRLHTSKGIDILIKSTAALLSKGYNVNLDIIGNGDQKTELLKLVDDLKIFANVQFLGGKTKAEVLNAFNNAYCAVVPSNSEAFGFTVIEAMSVETCVIGANNTGIKEIIIPNETGLLFETGNINDLTSKLETILLDEAERCRLAENGFNRFNNFYETNYAVNRDFVFFDKLVASKNNN